MKKRNPRNPTKPWLERQLAYKLEAQSPWSEKKKSANDFDAFEASCPISFIQSFDHFQ